MYWVSSRIWNIHDARCFENWTANSYCSDMDIGILQGTPLRAGRYRAQPVTGGPGLFHRRDNSFPIFKLPFVTPLQPALAHSFALSRADFTVGHMGLLRYVGSRVV